MSLVCVCVCVFWSKDMSLVFVQGSLFILAQLGCKPSNLILTLFQIT